METLFFILKLWLVSFVIIFPIALVWCKGAKIGDEGNGFVNK